MTTPHDKALADCPFCGSSRIDGMFIRDGWRVGCLDCGGGVSAYHPNAHAKAAEKWNRRAPIEAGNGGAGWLPIETAPKDGIKIDVGVLSQWGFERHCDIWWSAKRDSWVFWGDNGFERYGEVRISFDPTHWRPLPAPPSIPSDEGSEKP